MLQKLKYKLLGSESIRHRVGRHKRITIGLLIRALIAEFFGTFILVFFLLGTTVISLNKFDYVAAALGEGFAVMIGIFAVAAISGGHLNPAVTWGLFLTGRLPSLLTYSRFSSLDKRRAGDIVDVIGRVESTGPLIKDIETRSCTTSARFITLLGRGRRSNKDDCYTIIVALWGSDAEKPGWFEDEHPIIALNGAKVSDAFARSLTVVSTASYEIEPMNSQAIGYRRWLANRIPIDPIPLSNPNTYTEGEFSLHRKRKMLRVVEVLEQFMIGVLYIGMQLVGAIVGAALVAAVLLDQDEGRLATTTVAPGYGNGRAVLIEAIMTFILVFIVFATAVDRGGRTMLAPFPIGIVVFLGFLIAAPFTGASLNPARSFGPAVIKGIWSQHWVYWVGPFAGATIAAIVYELALTPRTTVDDQQYSRTFAQDLHRDPSVARTHQYNSLQKMNPAN